RWYALTRCRAPVRLPTTWPACSVLCSRQEVVVYYAQTETEVVARCQLVTPAVLILRSDHAGAGRLCGVDAATGAATPAPGGGVWGGRTHGDGAATADFGAHRVLHEERHLRRWLGQLPATRGGEKKGSAIQVMFC